MTIIVFIIVLAVLILVHELGHFIAAKWANARVDEFGIGFPPRALSYRPKGSETTYSINWIPFGGFVKIHGEDAEDSPESPDAERSLSKKSPLTQIGVLIAGVMCNVLLAWVIFSIGFMAGMPMSVSSDTRGLVGAPSVTILQVMPETPAKQAGLLPGDEIRYLELPGSEDRRTVLSVEDVQTFIGARAGEPFTLGYVRSGVESEVEIVPTDTGEGGRGAIGVALDSIGVVRLPVHLAVGEGLVTTLRLTWSVAAGLWGFLANAVTGSADLAQISGPVGIAGLVGDAASRGIIALLSFTAVISLNLAVLNLMPFPALDGGRILFVIIEAVKGTPIRKGVAQTVNAIGFALLIILMLVVTVHDIVRLF